VEVVGEAFGETVGETVGEAILLGVAIVHSNIGCNHAFYPRVQSCILLLV